VFFFVMILNGAVIFAAGPRRMLGGALVAALVWIWRPIRRERPGVLVDRLRL
jgi:hypothetical protein